MPRTKRYFENGKIYHVILRRMGNELLFKDQNDYFRMIFYLYECNTPKNIVLRLQREKRKAEKLAQVKGQTPVHFHSKRELLVEIFAFCLMPNHIHLLLRQIVDKGISKFIQKVASGYSAYFNLKYKTQFRGHFYHDRFTAVPIDNDHQLQLVFVYIHTNPISLVEPGWKELKVDNPENALDFLQKYRWSSYLDYIGKKNFPSVLQKESLAQIFSFENLQELVKQWVNYKHNLSEGIKETIKNISLE